MIHGIFHFRRSPLHSLACAVFGGVLLLAGVALPARAEKIEQLRPTGYVNDFAGVLGEQARQQLTALCAEVDQKAQAQVAIVTVRALDGLPIEDFSVRLATRWGIGPKKSDRGVLILLAVGDRQYRVEVGYGLESILPDGRVGGFGREIMPLLRQGDYGGAMLQLTSRIADVIAQDRGVTLGSSVPRMRGETGLRFPWRGAVFLIFFVVLFVVGVLRSILRGVAGGAGYRGRRSGGGWFIGPLVGGGLSGGGWSGGSFGGGGGGFGGFGGGSFGGGGASGSW